MNQQIELLFWNLDHLVGDIFKHSGLHFNPTHTPTEKRKRTHPQLLLGLETP